MTGHSRRDQAISPPMEAPEVLKFWFERDRKAWFKKNEAIDAEIRRRFLELYDLGAAGKLVPWKVAPASCLALVVLLDQDNLHPVGELELFDLREYVRAEWSRSGRSLHLRAHCERRHVPTAL